MTEDQEAKLDISIALFVQSLGYLLDENEGIIIHHEGEGYVVWKNPFNKTIEVLKDEDYLTVEDGRRTWVHHPDSDAPLPDEFDEILGDVPTKPKNFLKN